MTVKPYQSSLIPHEEEIIALRSQRPPVPYARIAELLREKYNLIIQRAAIFKFIKVRSRGRKVYSYRANRPVKGPTAIQSAPKSTDPAAGQAKPRFDFKYSERYNLTRLQPEEAAARRKKLEEEGH
ncbi:MAG TPA: hypothetical protein VE398_24490 [Acidobacteriota bacterium]|nr:hypothetical protein [Acidobacteriota bacterium]